MTIPLMETSVSISEGFRADIERLFLPTFPIMHSSFCLPPCRPSLRPLKFPLPARRAHIPCSNDHSCTQDACFDIGGIQGAHRAALSFLRSASPLLASPLSPTTCWLTRPADSFFILRMSCQIAFSLYLVRMTMPLTDTRVSISEGFRARNRNGFPSN